MSIIDQMPDSIHQLEGLYSALDLSRGSAPSDDQIRKSAISMIRRTHPDKNPKPYNPVTYRYSVEAKRILVDDHGLLRALYEALSCGICDKIEEPPAWRGTERAMRPLSEFEAWWESWDVENMPDDYQDLLGPAPMSCTNCLRTWGIGEAFKVVEEMGAGGTRAGSPLCRCGEPLSATICICCRTAHAIMSGGSTRSKSFRVTRAPQRYPQVQWRQPPSLPPEILNYIFRLLGCDYPKDDLISCSTVNKEWRRRGWPMIWRKVHILDSLEAVRLQFSLPGLLNATTAVRSRWLVIENDGSIDPLPCLISLPVFKSLRCLTIDSRQLRPCHIMMCFHILPSLTYLRLWGLRNDWLARGSPLGLSPQEESETWKRGLAKLKGLEMQVDTDDETMMEKLRSGLGPKLESLRLHLNGNNREGEFDGFLATMAQSCKDLPDFAVEAWRMEPTPIRCPVRPSSPVDPTDGT
ncbi:hypothetical protein HK104_006939 [Borealophlyctis nickersoniae]|nr:hypothetical protein HK104_006939 [Borealophlyctis nickersoniae]